MLSSAEIIQRIARIRVQGVRGFKGHCELDTNADVVLITGCNGLGKSSLIDIASLVANGGPDARVRADWRFIGAAESRLEATLHVVGRPEATRIIPFEKGQPPRSDGFRNVFPLASVWCEDYEPEPWLATQKKNRQDSWIRELLRQDLPEQDALARLIDRTRSRLASAMNEWPVPGVESEADLARDLKDATTMLNEAWKAAAQALPTEFTPVSLVIRNGNISASAWGQLRARTNLLLRSLGTDEPEVEDRTPRVALLGRLELALRKFTSMHEQGRKANSPQVPAVSMASVISLGKALLGIPLVVAFQEDRVWSAADDVLVLPMTDEADQAIKRWDQQQLLRIQNNSSQIVTWRKLLDYYGPSRGFPGLHEIVRAIAELGQQWRTEPPEACLADPPPSDVIEWLKTAYGWRSSEDEKSLDQRLGQWVERIGQEIRSTEDDSQSRTDRRRRQEVANSLASVLRRSSPEVVEGLRGRGTPIDISVLLDCIQRTLVEQQVVDSEPAMDSVPRLADRVADVGRVLKRIDNREAALARAPGSQAARHRLDDFSLLVDNAKRICDEALDIPQIHLDRLSKVMKRILVEFRVADFMDQVHLNGWQLDCEAPGFKQSIQNLSTGQRTLVGMAQMVALNLVMEPFLPHRIMLLDDFTTSLDMAQIPSAAVLVRRLAYGEGKAGEGSQRQVFVSSHHEDLTNRLLDYLMPPEGRTLRVLEFRGWTKEVGPEIAQFDVSPLPTQANEGVFEEMLKKGIEHLAQRHGRFNAARGR